jgi:hypothetical protein
MLIDQHRLLIDGPIPKAGSNACREFAHLSRGTGVT